MNTQEKIEAARKKKEEGNILFKVGKYARASKRYEKVLHTSAKRFLSPLCLFPVLPSDKASFIVARQWAS